MTIMWEQDEGGCRVTQPKDNEKVSRVDPQNAGFLAQSWNNEGQGATAYASGPCSALPNPCLAQGKPESMHSLEIRGSPCKFYQCSRDKIMDPLKL